MAEQLELPLLDGGQPLQMDFRGNGDEDLEAQRADQEASAAVQAVAAVGQLRPPDGAAAAVAAGQQPLEQAAPAAFGPAHSATAAAPPMQPLGPPPLPALPAMQLLGLPLPPALAAMQPPSTTFAGAQGVAAPVAGLPLPLWAGLGLQLWPDLGLPAAASAGQPPPSQAAIAAFAAAPDPALAGAVARQPQGLPPLPTTSRRLRRSQPLPVAAVQPSVEPSAAPLAAAAAAATAAAAPVSSAAAAAAAGQPASSAPSAEALATGQPPPLAAAAATAGAAAPFMAGHAQRLQGLPAHAAAAGQPPPLGAEPAAAAAAAADDDSAALLGYARVAACSRGNLRQLLASRAELPALVQMEKLLPDEVSVLSGLLVRIKFRGKYHLVPIVRVLTKADGTPYLEVWSPAPPAASGEQPEFLHISIGSVSGSSPLSDEQWEAAGQREAAGLEALLQLYGGQLDLRETAAAVWRKRVALVWHAGHGGRPPSQQQQRSSELLRQLQDHASINWQERLLARQLHEQQAVGSPVQQAQGPGGGQVLPQAAPPQQQQQQQQQQQPGAPGAQQNLTLPQQQAFWRAAQSGMEAKRQEGGRLLDQQLRQQLEQPSAPAEAVVVEPLDWGRLPRCSNCSTCHPSKWQEPLGQLECLACYNWRLKNGLPPPVTTAALERRRKAAEQLFGSGALHPLPRPRKQEWLQQFRPQWQQHWQPLSQLLHPADSYGMQGRTTAEAASEAGVLSAFQHAVSSGTAGSAGVVEPPSAAVGGAAAVQPPSAEVGGAAAVEPPSAAMGGAAAVELPSAAAGGAAAVEPPSGAAGCAAAVQELLAGLPAAQAIVRLALPAALSRAARQPWDGDGDSLQAWLELWVKPIVCVAMALRRGPDRARYGPECMPFADILVSSSKLPNDLLPWEAKAAVLSFDHRRRKPGAKAQIYLAQHHASLSEAPAVQLLCASRAANPFIVAIFVRPEGEYRRAVQAVVRPLQNKVALFILPFEVILQHAANQRFLSCCPFIDDDGCLWVRDTPLPWGEYAVAPAELRGKIHLEWLQAVIQGQTSSVSGLLARYTATKLLEHGDLYSAGRLAVLVQPSLSMQLQQQRGQGDSLVCGRVLEHKHARPGDARLTAHRQRYSREVGACVLPAYPTDRQDGFIFHLQHWRQLLDWLGVSWGVLTGLLVYFSSGLAEGLGLTVKKWGATPARTGINNPANNWPHLLLLCTTRLGFGPGHEWLQALLQTGAYGAAGLAACPPAPLPFPVAVALRSLLQQSYDMPGEPEMAGAEEDDQGVAVGSPEAYNRLLAVVKAEEAADAAELASQEDPARGEVALEAEAWGPEYDMAVDFEPAGGAPEEALSHAAAAAAAEPAPAGSGEPAPQAAGPPAAELDVVQRRLSEMLASETAAAAGGPMERAAAAAAAKAAAIAARDAACAKARRLLEGLAQPDAADGT